MAPTLDTVRVEHLKAVIFEGNMSCLNQLVALGLLGEQGAITTCLLHHAFLLAEPPRERKEAEEGEVLPL